MTTLELYSKAARVIESCQTLEQCAMADAFRKAASMKILGYRSDLGVSTSVRSGGSFTPKKTNWQRKSY